MDPQLARGVAQFNAGEFFEAHETWEVLWNDTVGAEKQLIQGLVQIAAGYLKAESGIRGGAIKLLTRGSALIRQFPPGAFGLRLAPVVAAVVADLQRLQASHDTVNAPQLRGIDGA